MIEPLSVNLHATLDLTHRRVEVSDGYRDPGYQRGLVAAVTDEQHTWHVIVVNSLASNALFVPAYRKSVYVGDQAAAWLLEVGVKAVLVALGTQHPGAALDRLMKMMQTPPFVTAVGDILDVRYEPHIDAVVARRVRHFEADADTEPFEVQATDVHERLESGIAARVGGYEAEICEDVTGQGRFTERVVDAMVRVAETDPRHKGAQSLTACTDLVERTWELYSKGRPMTKRSVNDVSQYGPDLGYSTERQRQVSIESVMTAAQSLLAQAASVNEGGRNPEHVDLFMQRVIALDTDIEQLREQVDAVAEVAQLARMAVGRSLMEDA